MFYQDCKLLLKKWIWVSLLNSMDFYFLAISVMAKLSLNKARASQFESVVKELEISKICPKTSELCRRIAKQAI